MRRLALLVALVSVLGAALPQADAGAASARQRALKMRLLKPFDSCSRLVHYARRYAPRELRGGVIPPSVAPGPVGVAPPTPGAQTTTAPTADGTGGASPDSSSTNVQEQGVDEPDIVKTDGTHIFAVANGKLNAIDARAATPKLLGSLDLPGGGGDLLLHGDHVLVVGYGYGGYSGGGPIPVPLGVATGIAYPYYPSTTITDVDVSDPSAMKVVKTQTIDGIYVSARLNGATARVVLSSSPLALEQGGAALRTRVSGWLPSVTTTNAKTGRKSKRRLTSCGHVRRPRVFSGLDLLTVLTIDMDKGLPAIDTDGLMTDGQIVYASKTGLYVATEKFIPEPAGPDVPPPSLSTAVHRFDISDPDRTAYASSGELPGYLLNQFALSEYRGVLRAATTDSPVWWAGQQLRQSQSYVTTLKESGGVLLPLGQVSGIGLGERIQGVRFVDDAAFVVTFRQVDPLFTVDLSQPNSPRVAGELQLLGYSAYLHPIGPGRLLGIGQDATAQGRQTGTQLSLFDVSDLAHPERLAQQRIGSSSSSEVEYDHHAFLYWAPQRLAVLPVQLFGQSSAGFVGAIGFRISSSAIGEVGRISHDEGQYPAPVRRSVVIGNRLFTISDLGAKSNALTTFAEQAWVPFPQPPPPPPPPEPGPPGPPQPATAAPKSAHR
jgi:hypothetical protein